MFDVAAMEFPFLAGLDKREKSRVSKAWEVFHQMREAQAVHGLLLPQPLAAELGGVCRQRITQLVDMGRLQVVDVGGHPFITENSLVEWVKSERKSGRPRRGDKTWGECREIAKSLMAK